MPRVSSHFSLQDPRFGSVIFETIVPAAITADANTTYTTAQIAGGFIIRSGLTTGRSDTLPSAAALVEAVQGCMVNLACVLRIRNISASVLTINPGAGGSWATGAGTQTQNAAATSDRILRILFTNVTPGSEAYVLYSLGGGAY